MQPNHNLTRRNIFIVSGSSPSHSIVLYHYTNKPSIPTSSCSVDGSPQKQLGLSMLVMSSSVQIFCRIQPALKTCNEENLNYEAIPGWIKAWHTLNGWHHSRNIGNKLKWRIKYSYLFIQNLHMHMSAKTATKQFLINIL